MESTPPHSHDSHEDPDALPDGITRATIKRAVDRAMHPYKYAVMDNIQLIVVTAVVAYLLHKFLRRKKADRYNAHVLGTAADSDLNNRADWTKQSDADTSDKGVKGTKPRKSGGKSTTSAAKDAASNRNYEKLSAKAMPESEQPSASKELGSKESNRNYEKLSAKATPESEQPSASKELGSKEDAGTGVASYLNLDKFMSGTIGGVHSLFKECDTNQSADGTNQPSSSNTSNITTPTVELHTTAKHPGLEAYYHWKSTIMSLYRVYAIPLYSYPPSADGASHIQDAILPMQPSSERGNTPVYIEVMNLTSQNVAVYWIDYKGNEVYKGSMRTGDTWAQTTWIGHPWVFRKKTPGGMNDDGQESVLLKYVPFRVIPSIEGAETILHEESGETVGIQRFLLKDTPKDYGVIVDGQKWTPACVVEDSIMPEPPLVSLQSDGLSGSNASDSSKLMGDIYREIEWSCQQMKREEVNSQGCGITAVKRLRQYLSKVSMFPQEPKYRKLRICNTIFMHSIYNTGARGVLLALGFEEHYGYLECGAAEGVMLTDVTIRMVSEAMAILFTVLDEMESSNNESENVQPHGADGFGRAGYGHAGSINRFFRI